MTDAALRLLARHRTELAYAGSARESVNEVRLTPVSGARQLVESAQVLTDPPVPVSGHLDAFGNEVRWFQVVEGHEALTIEAQALVSVRAPAPLRPALEAGAEWGALAHDPYCDDLADMLAPSTYVRWGEAVAGLAADMHVPRRDGVEAWVRDLSAELNRTVAYEQGVTRSDTTVEEVARLRRGVCQDLAHLAIALCRREGVAARYVSGWLYHPANTGPCESHAWVEANVPGAGWVEVDPTHPEPVDARYVRVAVGRDYADVAPVKGTYLGGRTESMEVTVEIVEMDPFAMRPASAAGGL